MLQPPVIICDVKINHTNISCFLYHMKPHCHRMCVDYGMSYEKQKLRFFLTQYSVVTEVFYSGGVLLVS